MSPGASALSVSQPVRSASGATITWVLMLPVARSRYSGLIAVQNVPSPMRITAATRLSISVVALRGTRVERAANARMKKTSLKSGEEPAKSDDDFQANRQENPLPCASGRHRSDEQREQGNGL